MALKKSDLCASLWASCDQLRGGMDAAKTTTSTFHIEPALKKALRTTAARDHRSIANMVEVLIRDYCGRNGIVIPELGRLLDDSEKPKG